MTIATNYKNGFVAAKWGSAPIYPNGVWPQRVALGVPNITGYTIDIYARNTRRSTTKLFDIPFSEEVENNEVILYPLASEDDTGEAFLNPSLWITCQATENATGDIYIIVEGDVPVGVGAITDAPPPPPDIPVSDLVASIDGQMDDESWRYKRKTTTFDADDVTMTFVVPDGSFVAGTAKLTYRGYRTANFIESPQTGEITTTFAFGAPKVDTSNPGNELILDYETL